MGKLIDVDKFLKDVKKDREHEIYLHSWTADMVLERLDSWYAPAVEAIPKDQYEARLKADMIAMLEDLDLEIDESAAYNLEVAKVQRLIRDRIDNCKESINTEYRKDKQRELTTYQIYLILLGYLTEHANTEMLKPILTELYRRAEGEDEND